MKKLTLLFVLAVSACATPKTVLRDEANGSEIICGGGRGGAAIFGAIGYAIEKGQDEKCVNDAKKMGLVVKSTEVVEEKLDPSAKPDSIKR